MGLSFFISKNSHGGGDVLVYILYNKRRDRFYTGQTNDVGDRFIRHNQGSSKATKGGRPWRLVYGEKFKTRSEAIKRERQIKAMKDRNYIIDLVKTYSA